MKKPICLFVLNLMFVFTLSASSSMGEDLWFDIYDPDRDPMGGFSLEVDYEYERSKDSLPLVSHHKTAVKPVAEKKPKTKSKKKPFQKSKRKPFKGKTNHFSKDRDQRLKAQGGIEIAKKIAKKMQKQGMSYWVIKDITDLSDKHLVSIGISPE